ncbi:MAG TPA: hypothetical protein VL860_00510, partial [Planctomycetota bacterium]|nr:hypothetical protein [Planctomycetota bacterium]
MRRGTGRQIGIWLAGMLAAGTLCPAEACGSEAAVPAKPAIAAVAPLAAKKAAAPAAAEPAAPPKETPKPALDLPPIARLLSEGEMLVVAPGQNLTVESPAQSERRLPVIDQITGGVRWVVLPAREKQVVSIRWLDTSNIKKLVEIEML